MNLIMIQLTNTPSLTDYRQISRI